jgi:hypothetical protein
MGDGTLRAPSGSVVTLAPVRDFYCIEIILPAGPVGTCIIHRAALEITQKEAKPWA